MGEGNKKRLAELNERQQAAEAIGQAVLDCEPADQARVCAGILDNLKVAHSRNDLLLVMDIRKIECSASVKVELKGLLAKQDKKLKQRQASAEAARQKLQDKRDYEAWKKAQDEAKRGKTNTPLDHEDDNDDEV